MINVSTRKVQKEKKTLYPKSVVGPIAKIQHDPNKPKFQNILSQKKYLAFGDSFVNMFLHAENAYYIKLKGKSIKGLSKANKQQRLHIQKWVKACPKSMSLIFNFGQVDLNLVRYYKVIHNQQYPEEIFQQYVNWIASLNRKTYIIGVFATPIQKQDILSVLRRYGTLKQQVEHDSRVLQEYDRTQYLRLRWNTLIESACNKNKIQFINIFDYDTQLKHEFLDQNPKTIHLRYLPCILEVKKLIPSLVVNIERANQIEQQYQNQKSERYLRNIKQMQERKQLESLDTKAEDNSSSEGNFPFQNDNASQFDQEGTDIQNAVAGQFDFFVQLEIPKIQDLDQLFFRLINPRSDRSHNEILDHLIRKGIKWSILERDVKKVQLLLNLIKEANDEQKKNAEDKKKYLIQTFVSRLQLIYREQFTKEIFTNDDLNVYKIVSFILKVIQFQGRSEIKIFNEKILMVIVKQVIEDLLGELSSKREKRSKGETLKMKLNSLLIIENYYTENCKQKFKKVLEKEGVNEREMLLEFMQISMTKQEDDAVHRKTLKEGFANLNAKYKHAMQSQLLRAFFNDNFHIEIKLIQQQEKLQKLVKFHRMLHQMSPKFLQKKMSIIDQQLNKKLLEISKKQILNPKEISEQYIESLNTQLLLEKMHQIGKLPSKLIV